MVIAKSHPRRALARQIRPSRRKDKSGSSASFKKAISMKGQFRQFRDGIHGIFLGLAFPFHFL